MVLSDNGATAEGGPLGTRSPVPAENGMPDGTGRQARRPRRVGRPGHLALLRSGLGDGGKYA